MKRIVELSYGLAGFAVVLILAAAIAFLTGGCWSESMGSKTIVGNHKALPKISNDTSNTDVEVYESTEGAVVYTRRDCEVEIAYSNVYTNSIMFGAWESFGNMNLGVKIVPMDVSGASDTSEPQNQSK